MSIRPKKSPIWLMPENKFRELVRSKSNYTEILKHFGLLLHGGNNQTLKARIEKLKLDISHFKRSNPPNKSKALKEILVENSTYKNRTVLKKRLLASNLIKNECSICNKPPVWNQKPLVMILDHINGKSRDNRLENLRLVCPNCNSQLSTFAGRNRKKESNLCLDCFKPISRRSKRCGSCSCKKYYQEHPNKNWPNDETLIELRKTMTYEAMGQKYGVSGNSVRKKLNKIAG